MIEIISLLLQACQLAVSISTVAVVVGVFWGNR